MMLMLRRLKFRDDTTIFCGDGRTFLNLGGSAGLQPGRCPDQAGRTSQTRRRAAPLLLTLALAVATPGRPAWQSSTKSTDPAGNSSRQLEREAASALQQGDVQKAISAYQKLVVANPRSAEFRYQLGMAHWTAGEPRDALAPLEEALKLKPELSAARYILSASLAESGECDRALPGLKEAGARVTETQLSRRIGLDGVKCAMELDQEDDALAFIHRLRRQFPKDPEVLYVIVHAFSDLSTRASQTLFNSDPDSYQVHQLAAESLESQGKWDEAAEEYGKVLASNPNQPGIHYLLGRLILSKPKTPTTLDDAAKEFKAELEVDPRNAGAEYVLGELALRSQDWNGAIGRFSNAAKDDPHFVDAKWELGKALISAERPAEAIAPLESAVKLQPENPAPHYLLSTAYRRVGRPQDADRELAAFQNAQEKARENMQNIRSAVTGRKTPAQTENPPEP